MKHRLASTVLLSCLGLPWAALAISSDTPEPATLRVEPSELTLRIGEPAELRATVLDAEGNELSDVPVLFLPLYGQSWNLDQRTWGFNLFQVRTDFEEEFPRSATVTGSRAGTYEIMVRVPKDADARRLEGDSFVQQTIPVTVLAPPITRIELEGVPERFYEGTLVSLEAHAVDAAGDRRVDAPIAWRSSDESVAVVDATGTVQLVATGSVEIVVSAEDATETLRIDVATNPTARLDLSYEAPDAPSGTVRTGDVVRLDARAENAAGERLDDVPVIYSFQARTDPLASGGPSSGLIDQHGRFVADLPGDYTLVATSGAHVAVRQLHVEPRSVQRRIELVGHGRVPDRATSDLWVWEGVDGRDYAITGTHSAGGHAYIWEVTRPESIELIDVVRVDARTVNDVKVSDDGRIAVLSREGASNRRNGVVVLDVSEPQRGVRVLSGFDDQLLGGVHNTFLYEDHLYALSAGQRYDVISLEDPQEPRRVGRFELDNPDRSIHDVVVHEGIAYSANWKDGVVVVDVGGGDRGGSPSDPRMMGRFPFPTGWNHAVYPYRSRSTDRFYIFAGDEAARTGSFSPDPEIGTGTPGYDKEPPRWRGWIHVVEWGDGSDPRLVARYEVPEAGSHNIWIEDDVMYVAFYNGGLRVVDVSGELMGDLYRQGREIARFLPFDAEGFIPNAPQVWGAQPHKGTIFFSDFSSGLWAVRLVEETDAEQGE